MTQTERRAHPRFAYDVEAAVLATGVEPIAARTVDISFSGVCLTTETRVEQGSWVQVELRLIVPGGTSDTLSLPAKIVWCTPTGGEMQVGAKFAPDMSAVLLARLDVLLQFLSGELDVPRR